MAASFISYENDHRTVSTHMSAKTGATLSSSTRESLVRRFLNALAAWREKRQKQRSLKKTLALDPETLRDISGMTAAELSEQMQIRTANQAGVKPGAVFRPTMFWRVRFWRGPRQNVMIKMC